MKNFLIASVMILSGLMLHAQEPAATAKNFIRQGDYTNAILVLNRALQSDRENIDLKKDLALAYYLQRDYPKAISTLSPVVDSRQADEQCFQILGTVYKAVDNLRDAERVYRTGIRRFSESGALYSEYGELLWSRAEFADAAKQWIRGIQNDPNYSGNYYNACRYYFMSADKVWGLIYGEMFVNLESFSKRTPEVKTMLLEGYKKLFSEIDINKNQDNRNDFVKTYLELMKKQSAVVGNGISPDALASLRTRFLLDWYNKNPTKFPLRLFEYQRQLARAGLFEAYNQWIFGAANNLSAFQQWTVTHPEEYNRFNTFQKSRVFKVPDGQFYNSKP